MNIVGNPHVVGAAIGIVIAVAVGFFLLGGSRSYSLRVAADLFAYLIIFLFKKWFCILTARFIFALFVVATS